MGGEVGVDSAPGMRQPILVRGRARSRRAHAHADAASPADGLPTGDAAPLEARLRATHAGARVLLAEDNAANLEVALEWLRAAALQVDVADHTASVRWRRRATGATT